MSFSKKIELLIKKNLKGFVFSNKEPILIDNPVNIFKSQENLKVLLLRQDRIGDVLITTPILPFLKQIKNIGNLDVILSNKNISTIPIINHYFDNIFVYSKNLFKIIQLIIKLKLNKYDCIIDLFDKSSQTSSLIIRLLNPKVAIGLDKENRGVYSHVVPLIDIHNHHIIERISKLLLPFGISPNKSELIVNFHFSTKNQIKPKICDKLIKHTVVINLAGSNRNKFWGIYNNIKLITYIKEIKNDIEIILLYQKDYLKDAEEIITKTGINQYEQPNSLSEYIAHLALADLIITPDTAAVHFASGLKIPVIVFFNTEGKTKNGMPWYPWGVNYLAYEESNGNIMNIKPELVFEGFKEILNNID